MLEGLEKTVRKFQTAHTYQFGEFRLETVEERLYRNGERLNINRRTFQVLRLLIERAGKIVSKQDFFDIVWADTFVEDNSLTVTMTTLRKVLGDNPKQAKFIENLPRKGYRFIAEVKIINDAANQVEESPENTSMANVEDKTTFRNRKIFVGVFAGCLVLLLTFLGFNYLGFSPDKTSSANALQIESIAVLPFENQNADTEYISDGLTESIINNLSGMPDLRVISRNSVFQYKNKETDLTIIESELNVQAVLTGRFVQRSDSLTVSVELTDLRDNKQIWGRQYNRQVSEIFNLQQEISRDISETLRSKLTADERRQLKKRETDNSEAFQFYLKGRQQWNKRTNESLVKAIEFFNQAIEKDPTYALAYVGLANCYLLVNAEYIETREKRVAMVKAAAQKALEIDPDLGEAYAALAINSHFNEWDWTNADKEYKLAIELNPNYATVHHWYAEFLATEGRFDESFAAYERALKLDPLSLAINTDLGFNYYYSHQPDLALAYLQKLKSLNPNYTRTYIFLADVYEEKGMFEEAIAENDKGYTLNGNSLQILASRKTALENALETSGAKGYWRKLSELSFADGEKLSPVKIAECHSRLGETDKAIELLEQAYNERSPLLVWLKVSPEFDGIRFDPRFIDLMHRVGIP